MKLDDVLPSHCYAHAHHLVAEIALVRDEMGRAADSRPDPEITGAQPRDCYFEAIATWRKADRLADELGVRGVQPAPAMPALRDLRPGHVLQLIQAVQAQLDDVKKRLDITEKAPVPAAEPARQPSDVLVMLIRANRVLSRLLERPFTPSDVHHTVALALAYAERLGAGETRAPFERGRKPADCYRHLQACLATTKVLSEKHGNPSLTVHGAVSDALPSDVYDLANLVLGEVAFLHSLTPNAAPMHALEPGAHGHRLPAHVDQLARTLATRLAAL